MQNYACNTSKNYFILGQLNILVQQNVIIVAFRYLTPYFLYMLHYFEEKCNNCSKMLQFETKVHHLLKNVAVWGRNATLFYEHCMYKHIVTSVTFIGPLKQL